MLTILALASVILLGIVPQQSEAIVIYTGWERHALVGSDIRLSCSVGSVGAWGRGVGAVRMTSNFGGGSPGGKGDEHVGSFSTLHPRITRSYPHIPSAITGRSCYHGHSIILRYAFSRSSLFQVFHYAGGSPYVDNKGPFRDRLEFVGNPGRRDGSILLKNLDYGDNGTFTCDAKNPPDIVGRASSVRLLVFEKVPIQAGVITGAIIGAVLGLLVLVVVIYYLMRFLVARRVFNLSVSKHGKKGKGKEGSQQRQVPVLSIGDPSKLKAAASEKKKQESRKDKK
nr:myelin protein P0-like [Oncorhynchus nerka]